MDDAEVTSTCKLTENDDGILVLDHGLDKCGTIMEYKRETEQIVFTVSNVVNFQGNSPSIVRLNSEDFSKFFLCVDILVLTYPYESTHSEVNNNAEIVSGILEYS